MTGHPVESLWRQLTPQVLGAVVRRYGHFDLAEDAVQEALIAAAERWPADGVPENPLGWLITVAARRLTDLLRAEQARRRREESATRQALPLHSGDLGRGPGTPPEDIDDTLVLLFLCCHPALPPASQIALTLRAVGGLTTAEIARGFLVPEATMTRRITRAKQRIRDSGLPFRPPSPEDRAERLRAVLHVLYLIFNEGYASTSGPRLARTELTTEAIRLTRLVHRLLPDRPEVTGLLALLLLTDARRPARSGPDGRLIPMAEQDRSRWDADLIAEGTGLVEAALLAGRPDAYQVQAAIAALHDAAPGPDDTDWPQILALYEVLLGLSDNPVVALNHTVALAMVRGPGAGLRRLETVAADPRLARDHRVDAVRGHLLELAGDPGGARTAYRAAADRTTSGPQRRYLLERAEAAGESVR